MVDPNKTDETITPERRIALLEQDVGNLSFKLGYYEERDRHVRSIVNDRVMNHSEKIRQLRHIVNLPVPLNE